MAILQHELFESKQDRRRGPRGTTEPSPKGKKQCAKCRKVKLLAAFASHPTTHDRHYPDCRACVAARDKKHQEVSKASSWKRNYGLSEQDYWEMFNQQGGVCAICHLPEIRIHKGVIAHLSVDHDHVTGNIRGLLCHKCNIAIGYFQDDVIRLQAAIDYLNSV